LGAWSKQVAEALAVDGALPDAIDLRWHAHADELDDGRQHVDRVSELEPDAVPVDASGRPGDDTRVGDATLVHLPLPPAKGRVPAHGPAPRIVVVAERAADLLDPLVHLVSGGWIEIDHSDVVDRAGGAALGTRPVIGDHHDDGVVAVAEFGEEVEHPANLLV